MNDSQIKLPHQEASPPAIAKASMSPGGAIAALVPQSLDDAFRLAKALAQSGDMVPKHFQGKPEATMAAIVRGMEIGLAPMQALANIAVINGRASIWGDALPALLQRAGHHLDCELQGEGDHMVAVATLTRGDTGLVITRSFSVADAKKAGLWGKQGPWQSYPKRMLEMRARSFAARDGAADALMGLQVAEEMQDVAPMRDVTPAPRGPNLAARLQQRAQEPDASQPITGEIMADEPQTGHWTDTVDLDAAFPGADAYTEGAKAAEDTAKALRDCPYAEGTQQAVDWCGGFAGQRGAMA
jgi:hypothetical protein